MTQLVTFVIPGPLGFDHRRIDSHYGKTRDGRVFQRPFPLRFMQAEYKAFRERARRALQQAKNEQGWVVPDKNFAMTMYLEYHIASHQWTKPKHPVNKLGRPNKPQYRVRNPLDEDNLKKGVKDSLQKDRQTAKHAVVDSRYLYLNDRTVNAYPFPGREWFVVEPGTEEWIVVALEVVGEFRPHVEQSKMALEEQF